MKSNLNLKIFITLAILLTFSGCSQKAECIKVEQEIVVPHVKKKHFPKIRVHTVQGGEIPEGFSQVYTKELMAAARQSKGKSKYIKQLELSLASVVRQISNTKGEKDEETQAVQLNK